MCGTVEDEACVRVACDVEVSAVVESNWVDKQ